MKLSTVCLSIIDATPTQGKNSIELSIVISVVHYYYTLRRKTKERQPNVQKVRETFFFHRFVSSFYVCILYINSMA